ncbi:MAG: type II secretion system F family protein [Lachnospiraceae bacterium]
MKKNKADYPAIWREKQRDIRFWIKQFSFAAIVIFLISYCFYRSIWILPVILPGLYPYSKYCRARQQKEKRQRFSIQLRDFLQLLSGNLQVGDSMEKAMEHTLPELEKQWGQQSFIYRDVEKMCRQIGLSAQTEEVLKAWGEQRKEEELTLFLQVFLFGRRTGGDLCLIIAKTTRSISARIETRQEIQTLLTSRKYEQSIMSAMPILIILYINLTNPGYLTVLYGNLKGVVFMSICLVIYVLAVVMGLKLIQIEGM